MRIGIEIALDPVMPELQMVPSPVAPDENNDNFFGLYYRGDVEVLSNLADEILFMRGIIGYTVQVPDITDDFRQFLPISYVVNWETRILRFWWSSSNFMRLLLCTAN